MSVLLRKGKFRSTEAERVNKLLRDSEGERASEMSEVSVVTKTTAAARPLRHHLVIGSAAHSLRAPNASKTASVS